MTPDSPKPPQWIMCRCGDRIAPWNQKQPCSSCGAEPEAAQPPKELLDFIRVLMEETVLAGYPGGDQTQTLANIRAIIREASKLRAALEQAIKDLRSVMERQLKTYSGGFTNCLVCGEQISSVIPNSHKHEPQQRPCPVGQMKELIAKWEAALTQTAPTEEGE